MFVVLTEQQHALFAHELDDLVIRLKHAKAGKVFDFGSKPSGMIDRTIDLQP